MTYVLGALIVAWVLVSFSSLILAEVNLAGTLRRGRRESGALAVTTAAFCALSVVLFVLVMVWAVPKLAAIFQDFDLALPAATGWVISLSNWFADRWYVALPVTSALFVVFPILMAALVRGRWSAVFFLALAVLMCVAAVGMVVVFFMPLVWLLSSLTQAKR